MVRALDRASDNLRALGKLDADNRGSYRAQFEELQDLRHVYENPKLIRTSLEGSIKIYFGLGFIGAVLLAVVAASLLSRRIARSYRLTYEELTRQREKVRYLQEMSSWQELARMLAHEIKNPLTPIEVLVSSLSRSYLQKESPNSGSSWHKTQRMIGEELDHLKNTVNRFGEFARLPQVDAIEQQRGGRAGTSPRSAGDDHGGRRDSIFQSRHGVRASPGRFHSVASGTLEHRSQRHGSELRTTNTLRYRA